MKTLILIFVLLATTCLFSTIINVPGDQPTIQAGIDVATDTDTVLVADGTYFENIDFIGKAITIASNFLIDGDESHIENTIINGSQPINPDYGSCIMFISGENFNSVLNGFTITAGSGKYIQYMWISLNLGGGIYCENSSPSLENVTITGNSAWRGGGIHCTNSSPSLNNVTIIDNSATGSEMPGGWGGGICCDINSSPSLVNVTITANSAYDGGGICCYNNSSPSLENVTITGNTAAGPGGGILCGVYASPSLVNVIITGNTAAGPGGGIYCWNNSNPILVNCVLWNDSPQEIYIYTGSVTATYSDIQGGWTGTGNIDEDPLFVGIGVYPFSLLENSPCIDSGNPDPIYYDPEDPNNPGYALYPAMGTIINDMGAYGGPNTIGWPVVGLDDNVIVQTPEIFLHQNYPNPFNPTTTINYTLKENGKVSLNIYNIKGQKVKQLVSDHLSAGQHSVVWNGTDQANKPVSSGIYFYKMKTDNYEETKRMVLIK